MGSIVVVLRVRFVNTSSNRITDLPRLIYFGILSFLNNYNDDNDENGNADEKKRDVTPPALWYHGNVSWDW